MNTVDITPLGWQAPQKSAKNYIAGMEAIIRRNFPEAGTYYVNPWGALVVEVASVQERRARAIRQLYAHALQHMRERADDAEGGIEAARTHQVALVDLVHLGAPPGEQLMAADGVELGAAAVEQARQLTEVERRLSELKIPPDAFKPPGPRGVARKVLMEREALDEPRERAALALDEKVAATRVAEGLATADDWATLEEGARRFWASPTHVGRVIKKNASGLGDFNGDKFMSAIKDLGKRDPPGFPFEIQLPATATERTPIEYADYVRRLANGLHECMFCHATSSAYQMGPDDHLRSCQMHAYWAATEAAKPAIG